MKPLSRLDQNVIPDADEIRLFAKVRNEATKLPFFLSYYRSLGIERFFFIDNDSTDRTVEFLLSKDKDFHVFATTEKLSQTRAGMDWIEPLLHSYGRNRWCVVVDADELLVYPNSETVGLRRFCQTLDLMNSNAFASIMLDMYPAGNLEDVSYLPGQSFIEASPFFDRSGYNWLGSGPNGPTIVGGPRLRMFFPEFLDRRILARILRRIRSYIGRPIPWPPILNKVPLVRWNKQMSFAPAAHFISGARLAKGNGALLHFKFLGDFSEHVKEELVRKAYFDEGREYQRYFERLRQRTPINFKCEISVRFTGTRQLLELALINEPKK